MQLTVLLELQSWNCSLTFFLMTHALKVIFFLFEIPFSRNMISVSPAIAFWEYISEKEFESPPTKSKVVFSFSHYSNFVPSSLSLNEERGHHDKYSVPCVHRCIPNLFSGAIELVCILVECKAQKIKNGRNSSKEPVGITWSYNTSVQSWVKWMTFCCSSQFSGYRDFHSTRSIIFGEPPPVSQLSWSREGLVNDCVLSELNSGWGRAAIGWPWAWWSRDLRARHIVTKKNYQT